MAGISGMLYSIPKDVSNMLFAYLSSFSTYELERLKDVYVHQIKYESNREEYIDILKCIENILEMRKEGHK